MQLLFFKQKKLTLYRERNKKTYEIETMTTYRASKNPPSLPPYSLYLLHAAPHLGDDVFGR